MIEKLARRSWEAGFTLIEVVVALTIVALGIVTVLEVFSLGLRLSARSKEVSQARLDGQSIMDEALVDASSQAAQEQGSFVSGNRWRLRTAGVETPFVSLGSPWELKEINVQVRFQDANREKTLELKTLILSKKTNP
ncbi:MAG: type IV pilus modification PilV family protein [Candidatus Binatia bacterium]